ncbi:pyrroline-5-carboxylate reductase [Actinobaculum suis]|nr:pyrroline-5-carboxylate reductase [Actinobaculum suis]
MTGRVFAEITERVAMIGFIGIGNLGGALARGLIAAGTDPQRLVVAAGKPAHARTFAAETGVNVAASNAELVAQAGCGAIIVLAVKPQIIGAVLEEIRAEASRQQSVIVSVAAGRDLGFLASHLEAGQAIVRTMPNVCAAVGESMTGIARNEFVSDTQLAQVREIFAAVGQVEDIDEDHFGVFSALAGCSPAYVFTFIDALARAGVKNGLSKQLSSRIAAQAMLGAARMALESDLSAADLADLVQSPGGTTVAGVVELEQRGFGAAIVAGAQASIDKDRSM